MDAAGFSERSVPIYHTTRRLVRIIVFSAVMRTSNFFILIVLQSSLSCYFIMHFFLSFSLQMIEWNKRHREVKNYSF